jgi:hypothetical protein
LGQGSVVWTGKFLSHTSFRKNKKNKKERENEEIHVNIERRQKEGKLRRNCGSKRLSISGPAHVTSPLRKWQEKNSQRCSENK